MPPPTPSQALLAAELERPDRDVQLEPRDRAREPDRPGVDAAGRALELGDHVHRRDLRRARDRPRRERGADGIAVADAVARARPLTSETRCQTPVCGRASASAPTAIEPGTADAAEVVADEVDDHHVLGAVLLGGRAARRARRPRRGSAGRGRVPLIGALRIRRPWRSRNSSGDRLATAPVGTGRRTPRDRARSVDARGHEQVDRVAARGGTRAGRRCSPGTDRRRGSARGTPPRRGVAGGAGRRAPRRSCRTAAARRRRAGARLEHRAGARAAPGAGLGPQRLEPPPPVVVEPQQVVVERQRAGLRARRRRAGRGHRFEPAAEPIRPRRRTSRRATASRGPPGRPERPGCSSSSANGSSSAEATLTGSDPISAPPPAQRPTSANGRSSSRTSSAAARAPATTRAAPGPRVCERSSLDRRETRR